MINNAKNYVPLLKTPSLSVVMCNYNHAKYLRQAIEAVVSQSRLPDEYIILDDGSTDNSVEIIEGFARRFSFIRFVRNERNLGLMAASERACAMVTGDYLYGAAADDYVLPGFFELAMNMAESNPAAGVIVGECIIKDPDEKELGIVTGPEWSDSRFIPPEAFLNDYLYKVTPTHSFIASVIYKQKELLNVGGFRRELGFWVDTFAFRAIGLRAGVCFIKHQCSCWHVMPGSFCQTTVAEPTKELEILGHLALLMKGSEFKGLFPSAFVDWWSTRYRDEIVRRAVQRLQARFGEVDAMLWPNLLGQSVFAKVLKALFLRFHYRYKILCYKVMIRSLERYSRLVVEAND